MTIDYFPNLIPNDLISLILQYRLLEDPDFSNCRRVCKKICNVFDTVVCRNLWNKLAISTPKGGIEFQKLMHGILPPETSSTLTYFQCFRLLNENIKTHYGISLQTPCVPIQHSQFEEMQQRLDASLNVIWPIINAHIQPPLIDPPETADDIRSFLNNAPTLEITELKLDDLNLEFLPREVGKLTNLKILNLKNNILTQLPDLSTLTNLKILNLESNNFTEFQILSEWAQLQMLNLANNQLKKITGLSNAPLLKSLQLNGNDLEKIDLSALSHLRELGLGSNKFTELPDDLNKLTLLQVLNLNGNELMMLDLDLDALPHLQTLHIEGNPWMRIHKSILEEFQNHLTIQRFNSELNYFPQKGVAHLYQMIMNNKISEDIQQSFQSLPHNYRKLISDIVWKLSDDPNEMEDDIFKNIQTFYRAVHGAILTKYKKLSPNMKNAVLAKMREIANDLSLNEYNAMENMPRLADAIELVELTHG